MRINSRALIILTAGLATRIRQLSFDRPKTLLSVNGQRLIERLLAGFAPRGTKVVIVAGRNAKYFQHIIEEMDKDAVIIDDVSCSDLGSCRSLYRGLEALSDEVYDRVDILEADIILTQEGLKQYESTIKLPKFIALNKECEPSDDKISFDNDAGHYVISKSHGLNHGHGKFLGVTSISGHSVSFLLKLSYQMSDSPYVNAISKILTRDAFPVLIREEHGAEIDSGEDYQKVLSAHQFCQPIPSSWGQFPSFQLNGFIQRWIGVYDVMGARIAQAAGFDGVWLGSFQVALSKGREDDSYYDPLEAVSLAKEIRSRGFHGAIVMDATNGWDNAANANEAIQRCIDAEIDAVVIDDNPKKRICSLYRRSSYCLSSPDEFARRIRLAVEAARSRLGIIARTESIVCGHGDSSRSRAMLAHEAGASAFVPHYVGDSIAELQRNLGGDSWPLPLVIIPTGLMETPIELFYKLGCRAIIYANIDLRLRIGVLAKAYRALSCEARLPGAISSLLCSPEEARELAAGINISIPQE